MHRQQRIYGQDGGPFDVFTAPDSDGWSIVWIPEVGQHTQAGHGYSVEDMAREAISLVTGFPESHIELAVREYAHKWWD